MIKWIKKFIRSINLFLIGLTLISYISPNFNPEAIWIMPFFSLALPVFLILNFVVMIFLYIIKHKAYWLNVLTLALSFFFLGDLVVFGSNNNQEQNTPQSIKVMTYNIQNFQKYTHYDDRDASFTRGFKLYHSLLEEVQIDIFCFQEGSNTAMNRRDKLTPYLKKYFQLQYSHHVSKSVGIFSKYPIINKGLVFKRAGNACIFVDIKKDDNIFRIYSAHLQSTGIAPEAEKVIDNPDMDNDQTKRQVRNIVVRLKKSNDKRARQVKAISEHILASPYPVILCGDFNDVPFSYTYRQLRKGLKDTFLEKGDGLGETYNGAIPLLRIDYIMASHKFQVNSHKVIHTNLSDHFPIVSELEWQETIKDEVNFDNQTTTTAE